MGYGENQEELWNKHKLGFGNGTEIEVEVKILTSNSQGRRKITNFTENRVGLPGQPPILSNVVSLHLPISGFTNK